MSFSYLDLLLFVALPYFAIIFFLIGACYRYLFKPFSVSSLSTQFLENRLHFWTEVPFHYGLLFVLTGHFIAFILPGPFAFAIREPAGLFAVEALGLGFGLIALIGLCLVIVRRLTDSRVAVTTTVMDWALYILLFAQISSGIGVAIFRSWGSLWFTTTIAPYLQSLVKLNPAFGDVSLMPLMVKFHIVCGFFIIAVVPFSRLMHVLVAPVQYLFRQPQITRWYRDTK